FFFSSFFLSSRRRHTRFSRDWSSDVCSSDLVGGDLEVVHGDFALFDQRTGAPATAIDHLLVGQYGLVYRVPVHGAVLAVDHALRSEERRVGKECRCRWWG